MVIFHSYVSLPEGNWFWKTRWLDFLDFFGNKTRWLKKTTIQKTMKQGEARVIRSYKSAAKLTDWQLQKALRNETELSAFRVSMWNQDSILLDPVTSFSASYHNSYPKIPRQWRSQMSRTVPPSFCRSSLVLTFNTCNNSGKTTSQPRCSVVTLLPLWSWPACGSWAWLSSPLSRWCSWCSCCEGSWELCPMSWLVGWWCHSCSCPWFSHR